MALNVCPCVGLKTGVKLVAIFDIVSTLIIVTLVIFAVAGGYTDKEDAWKIALGMALLGVLSAAQICAAGILYYGRDSINPKYSSTWLYVTGVIVLLSTLLLVGSVGRTHRAVTVYAAGITLYKCYATVVVEAFKASLMRHERGVEYLVSEKA